MSLFVASLNSGSNGNCYYVGNEKEAVLIDVGISCREIEKRMKRLALTMDKVKAIFISHEHGDHIHGVPALSKKYNIPVYLSPRTQKASNFQLEERLTRSLPQQVHIHIGDLVVQAFSKHHDAIDPSSFIVTHNITTVGVITDIGFACRQVVDHFKQCHAAFLEANYDEHLLENGSYPVALKNRIRNGKGHLSNKQAARLFIDHRPPFMSHLFLSHLSRNNNTPEAALQAFANHATDTEIIIAPRDRETPLYFIENRGGEVAEHTISKQRVEIVQLSLFG